MFWPMFDRGSMHGHPFGACRRSDARRGSIPPVIGGKGNGSGRGAGGNGTDPTGGQRTTPDGQNGDDGGGPGKFGN